MDDLLAEIEAFRRQHEMAESTFGFLALGDKPFVSQIKGSRRVWPETAEKVRTFMSEYKAEKAAA